MSKCTIEEHEHGVSIRGEIPVSIMCALAKAYGDRGLDLVDVAIAHRIGATMVIVSRKGGDAWRRELGIYP